MPLNMLVTFAFHPQIASPSRRQLNLNGFPSLHQNRRQQMQREREEQRARQEQMIRQQQEEAMAMRRRQDEMRLQQDTMRRRGGNDDMGGNRDQVGVLNLCHCKYLDASGPIALIICFLFNMYQGNLFLLKSHHIFNASYACAKSFAERQSQFIHQFL